MEKVKISPDSAIFLLVLVVSIVGASVYICTGQLNGRTANAATEPQEFTVGNSTFIPLKEDFSAVPAQKKLAMETVRKFEKAHPELTILCWNVNYTVGSMNVVVDGVYIYHRPK